MSKVYYVYLLECAGRTLYAGCTDNLEKRIPEHAGGKRGAKYTRARRPVKLVFSEIHQTLAGGRKREAEIKRLKRKESGLITREKIINLLVLL